MKEIKVNTAKTYTVPVGATHLNISHEWGDEVLATTAVSGTYSFTPDSIGVHKFKWTAGATPVQTDFYDSIMQLVSSATFFEEHPELDTMDDMFAMVERQQRRNIQNYTGQKFGPYVGKSLEIQGDGGDSLALPVRVLVLSSVDNNYGDDITELVEVSPNEPSFLQKSSQFRGAHYYEVKRDLWYQKENLFRDSYSFIITGSFGWEYVPVEVSDAASILIADMLGSDEIVELRRKGVFEAQIGDFSTRLNADQWGTTGNNLADNLLSAYVQIGFGLV